MKKAFIVLMAAIACCQDSSAQNCPSVTVSPSNQYTASQSDLTFSSTGKTIGFYKTGSSDVILSGTINFQNYDTLYIGPGVQFNPSNINNFGTGCRLIICGSASMPNSYTLNGGVLDNYNIVSVSGMNLSNFTLNNYGTMTISNSVSAMSCNFYNHGSLSLAAININSGASVIYNYNDGTMTMTQSFQLQNSGSTLTNEGVMNFSSNFNTSNSTTVLNKGRVYTATDFTTNGSYDNYGIWITNGNFTVNGGATVRNFCRLVSKQFSNSNGTTQNYGMIWATLNTYGAFASNASMINAGYIRTTTFQNNGTLTNSANNSYTGNVLKSGYIRIDGGSSSNESQNNSTISGGYIADIYNAYNLDYSGSPGSMTATVGNIPAYDTTTFLAQSFPSSCVELMVVKGTAWSDPNNTANNTQNVYSAGKKGANPSSPLYVVQYKVTSGGVATGNVLNVVQVGTDGSYSLPAAVVNSGPYKIMLSSANPGVGGTIPASGSVPSSMYATSPMISGILNSGGISDFGVEYRPTTYNTSSINNALNMANGTQVPTLSATDPEDGVIGVGGKFIILTIPDNAVLKYNGSTLSANSIITNYNPALLIAYPNNVSVGNISFNYSAVDNAGAQSASYGNSQMAFGSTPLPVKVLSFTGVAAEAYNELNWTINATEMSSMELQYSIDGQNFSTIHTDDLTVLAGEAAYSFRHAALGSTTNYYRLRFTESNGAISFSKVVVLRRQENNTGVSVYPNPFAGQANLNVTLTTATEMQLIITDQAGKTVKSMSVSGQAGQNNITIDGNSLSAGVYFITLRNEILNQTIRVSKQ